VRTSVILRFAIRAVPVMLLAAAGAGPATAQGHTHDHADLGDVRFEVSCEAVRSDFDHAVAMLHHMMYPEAREEFERIATAHPDCAMAHWGVAVTLFQPLWPARPGPEVRERGWAALQRARSAAPVSAREEALIGAAEAFFRDPAADEWWPRIRRWNEALEAAWRAHPEDVETSAFYALSLLAAGQQAENRREMNERAAQILAGLHDRQPQHPGAVHYIIHANDMTSREGESLDIVRSYGDIAPSMPHALHMPSHIFVRLGEWPEVIAWNRRSADAALKFPAGDRTSLHFAHALDYLMYSYLQRGEDIRAAAVLEEFRTHEPYQQDFIAAFHAAIMPARYAVERRAWDEAAAIEPRSSPYFRWDAYHWPEALSRYARGLGAARTGDVAEAHRAAAAIAELRDAARAAGEESFATYIEVDRLILAGAIAQAEGDAAAAVARLREAARLEGTVEKHPVTPGALLPPNEALGDLLLEQERPQEALEAYAASLQIWPRRYNSLLGAARAARAAGDAAAARQYYQELAGVTGDAATDRAGVREARDFIAGG
jgi:tetratricopeptide (TPR) repeat protein